MKRLVFFLLLLTPVLFAVEPKEVGSATVSLELQWILTGDFDGSKMLKTYGFPNTTFQTVSVTADAPFHLEKDSFGNELLVFEWSERGKKTINVKAVAKVNYDTPYETASPQDSSAFSSPTQLVIVDDSIATQASMLDGRVETDFEKLTRFTEWVHNALVYDDSFWERQPSSADVFIQRKGVCNQYAHLDMALLRAAGIPSRFAAGWVYSGKEWAPHAWVEVLIGGKWIPADPTYNEAGLLDGTHVLFAHGFDQLDIKEELSKGLEMEKKQNIEIVSWNKPRGFFSLALSAPQKIGSSASEKITVSLVNKDSKEHAVPLFLGVPTQPPELAVKVAGSQSKLVFLPANGMAETEWNVLFPKLEDSFTYNFALQVVSFGQKANASVEGEFKNPSPLKEKILLTKLESVQGPEGVSVLATLSNAGNSDGRASVFVEIGNQSQQQSILLREGEERIARFTFSKPLSETQGRLLVTSASGSFAQPFQIIVAPEPLVPEDFDYPALGLIAGVAVLLVVLSYFLRAKREPMQESG
ncbi:MAG: transglutaminase-like domain-containing protein [Candidatus Micrarchaeota archaeon]